MARTRGAKNSTTKTSTVKTIAEATAAASGTTPKVQLQPESTNPPKLFILPKDTSSEARIALLENPKTSELSRYLCCPDKGFYEFTKVGPPKTTPRSWLIAPSESQKGPAIIQDEKKDGSDFKASNGYVTKSSDLFIATPLDPLFLLIPALAPATKASSSESKRLFLDGDDYLDTLATNSPQFRPLLRIESIRKRLEMRMASVCDGVDAGDQKMYRLNEEKLFRELMGKAKKMVEKGLPASMEDKFVRRALEVPVLSISLKRGESSMTTEDEDSKERKISESAMDDKPKIEIAESESIDSQTTTTSSADSTTTTTTTISTATSFTESSTTDSPPLTSPENIPHLLRLKTAFNFIISSYLPPHLIKPIKDLLSNSTTPSFTELETHMKHLADLRRKVMESRALSNDYSRKRGTEDDEGYEGRAEKKRKLEEEEKRRKAGESRGVRELKKVDVSGMKKMSDFFKKKT